MRRSHAIRDHEEGASAARVLAFMATDETTREERLDQASREEDLAAAARNGTYPTDLED